MNQVRKIIHVDMDAFYASVEQRDNPEYRGKPLVVGSSPSQRGVVAAASYEARKYGIHSAMPSKIAVAKCPNLIIVRPRFDVYRSISAQIHDIFRRYTDKFEPVALDEAYLDVTENKQNIPYASTVARHIRTEIYQKTNLTASAGVSVNKFLAKMASGMNKPNGHGIGIVTASKMHDLGIRTGADLRERELGFLVQKFGKSGNYYYKIARAQDDRAVEPNRVRKSIGAENSFAQDLSDKTTILQELEEIARTLHKRLKKHQTTGRTLPLKVKFADYQQITRSKTLSIPINNLDKIINEASSLMKTIKLENCSIRLLGLSLSNLDNTPNQVIQLSLFEY